MKDIHEVLRRKQAQYAQLGKQIEMLQQAAEKLREVAPLLAETDAEDDSAVSGRSGRRKLQLHGRESWGINDCGRETSQLDPALAVEK